jgi:hypothetical protein
MGNTIDLALLDNLTEPGNVAVKPNEYLILGSEGVGVGYRYDYDDNLYFIMVRCDVTTFEEPSENGYCEEFEVNTGVIFDADDAHKIALGKVKEYRSKFPQISFDYVGSDFE